MKEVRDAEGVPNPGGCSCRRAERKSERRARGERSGRNVTGHGTPRVTGRWRRQKIHTMADERSERKWSEASEEVSAS